MKLYEGLFLVDNSEARKDYDTVSQNVSNIISKYGGQVVQSENWGERRLAYPVRRRDRGTYILVYFEAPPEAIVEIRRDCVIDEVILRNMILRATSTPEPKKEEEKADEKSEESVEETESEPNAPEDENIDETIEKVDTVAEKEPAIEEKEDLAGMAETPVPEDEPVKTENTAVAEGENENLVEEEKQ